ncbi:MAG TPA: ATP synthase F1 subunit delta [Phnomibacter sp.]|nr:ATP synthase F1 subunit delta [Phnomibacter sp.]
MVNPRLAARYAKSLIELATEQNQLEEIKSEVEFILSIFSSSKEFRVLMSSPIIKPEKKLSVLHAVGQDRFSPLMASFMRLLVLKGRESALAEMLETFRDQYNEIKGIHKVKFVTASPISDEMRDGLINKFKTDAQIEHIDLTTVVDPKIIGGFLLEYDNKLIDASIVRDLRDVKRQFLSNDYRYQIR